jgi:hypothetical protein
MTNPNVSDNYYQAPLQISEVRTISVGRKYKVKFEQGAVKGQMGFEVEAYDDNPDEAMVQALRLLDTAKTHAPAITPV